MPLPRLIPCLDVANGRVVKGVRFQGLRDVGDPVELGAAYSEAGADELVFLDVAATVDGRSPLLELVATVADELAIPFTVGGGVRSASDGADLLSAGADKVAVNSAAVERPELIGELAALLGSQAVVVAVDAAGGEVYTRAGKSPTGLDAVAWAAEAESRGAGEILLTSIDADGTQEGYDLELTEAVAGAVSIPVIASGGAGDARPRRRRARRRAGGSPRVDPPRAPGAPRARSATSSAASGCRFAMQPDLRAAVVQDADTGRVLMLAWMDDEALRRTRETGEAHFYSRSRARLWHKGETSGNTLAVEELREDCDGDAILVRARPAGPACHTGSLSCFAPWLWRRVAERAAVQPEGSYVAGLVSAGPAAAARKLGEEGLEAALAGAGESDERLVSELADLWFHSYVLLAARGLDPAAVEDELRRRVSGE